MAIPWCERTTAVHHRRLHHPTVLVNPNGYLLEIERDWRGPTDSLELRPVLHHREDVCTPASNLRDWACWSRGESIVRTVPPGEATATNSTDCTRSP